jgi:hypothetical protein
MRDLGVESRELGLLAASGILRIGRANTAYK